MIEMNSVPSLKYLSAVRVAAVELCYDVGFMKKLLNITKPEFEQYTNSWKIENEQLWDKMIKRKCQSLRSTLCLPLELVEDVAKWIQPISREILRWCRYHNVNFQIPNSYSLLLLNGSLFTSQGRIKKKKAAKVVANDITLSVGQRYKLACNYLLISDIQFLLKRMNSDQRQVFYSDKVIKYAHQSPMGKLWASKYLRRCGEFLRKEGAGAYSIDEDGFWRCAFDKSVVNGNEVATRFSWEKLPMKSRTHYIVRAGILLLKTIKEKCPYEIYGGPVSIRNDIEILCFLLSKMSVDVKKRFLTEHFDLTTLKLLRYLLDWHHEDIFMQTVSAFWEILTLQVYNQLLCRIYETYVKVKFANINDVTRDTYYNLYKEFWSQSPDNFKKFVIWNKDLANCLESSKDYAIIEFTLKAAPTYEKFNFISSNMNDIHRIGIFLKIFLKGDSKFAAHLIEWCQLSEVDRKLKLKDELEFVSFVCARQIYNYIETFYELVQFCLNSENEVKEFKKDFGNLKGNEICNVFVARNEWQKVNEFLQWCFSSQEEILDFKKCLKLSFDTKVDVGIVPYHELQSMQLFFNLLEING